MTHLRGRVIIAATLTIFVLGAVAVASLVSSSRSPSAVTTSLVPRSTTTSTADTVTTTTMEIPDDWYPKGSSLYSDRAPNATLPQLPETSAPGPQGG